jgi:hypothetical protein
MRALGLTIAMAVWLTVAAAGQGRGPQGENHDLPDTPSAVAVQGESVRPASASQEVLADDPYVPLSRQQKLEHFVHRMKSASTFVSAGEDVLFTRATGGFRYCCGVAGWGEQYGSSLADSASRQFFGDYLFPTLLKQDPRYFPLRRGSVVKRGWYAATRVLVTRRDDGRATFNYSEFLGVAFSRALANAYYPDLQRGSWETMNRIVGSIQSDATGNVLREFWPDIRRIVNRHAPKSIWTMERRLAVGK